MNNKQIRHLKHLLSHVDKHLMLSVDLIVSIDLETKRNSTTCYQRMRAIKRMIHAYKRKTKTVIEF